jgi:hypothetical protein
MDRTRLNGLVVSCAQEEIDRVDTELGKLGFRFMGGKV